MIIDKDGRATAINAEIWNDDVRIFFDAKEIETIKPDRAFLCKGIINTDNHCKSIMNAISMCKERGIYIGLVIVDEASSNEMIRNCAARWNIGDCVFDDTEPREAIKVIDTVELPCETMSGYYFVNADRMCGNTTNEVYEMILQLLEDSI